MKRISFIILAGSAFLAVGGCAKTVGPVEFLSVYRRSSPMMDVRSGYRAIYEGQDGRYHYLTVRQSTLPEGGMAMLVWGPYRDEKLRCPVEQLPYDFPDGFEIISAGPADIGQPEAQSETKEQTAKYVRRYLSAHHMPIPPPGK